MFAPELVLSGNEELLLVIKRSFVFPCLVMEVLPFLVGGCATPYKKPCTVQATITLTDEEGVNRICHSLKNLVSDSGEPLMPRDRVGGCADTKNGILIVRDNPETLFHEFKHLWEEHCR